MIENKKQIDKEIIITSISALIFVLVLIVTVVIVINSVFGYMKNTVNVGDFIVDYRNGSRIKTKLDILSNANGIKTEGYEISITNNGEEPDEYYLYIKNYDGGELPENLMVSFNDYIIKKANSFAQDGDYYYIYDGNIKNGYTAIHTLKFWWLYGSDESLKDQQIDLEFGIIEK